MKKILSPVLLTFLIIFLSVPVFSTDTDGDGMTDEYETSQGYNPLVETIINYVDVDRPDDSGDGLSLSTAKKTINAGLTLAKVNDGKEHVVLVADGTYTGTGNKELDFAGYDIKLRSIDGAATTIIDLENSGKALYLHSYETLASWFDGFTVKNGSTNTNGGGAVYLNNSSLYIKNCIFDSNYTLGLGGAVRIANASNMTIENSDFYNNSAEQGAGACYLYCSGTVSVNNCNFIGNQAPVGASRGGALMVGNNVTVTDCLFNGNHASHSSGAIDLNGGDTDFIRCKFFSNTSYYYGGAVGMLTASTSADFSECEFFYNKAGTGGAIYVYQNGSFSLLNCLLFRNRANAGGAVGQSSTGTGTISINNTTIACNNSVTGPGIYFGATSSHTLNIKNSIIWNEMSTGGATVTVNYSCTKDDYTTSGTGNIDSDPLLTPMGYLTSTSPCIDAADATGAPNIDLHGQSRPNGAYIDMGCDEFTDSDSDGIPDWYENLYGGSLDPNGDNDSDSVTNLDEYLYGLNPNSNDSDSDGFTDDFELGEGYSPGRFTQYFYVDNGRPDDSGDGLSLSTAKKTINAGLTLANQNYGKENIVFVDSGTYTGTGNKNLEFSGYDIKLRSIDGAATTIIDLEDSGRFVWFHYGETSDSWIDGFTFKNGNSSYGGVIRLNSVSAPVIKNCVFEDNYSSSGGAIYAYASAASIDNCTFNNNSGTSGGAIICGGTPFMSGFSINNSVFKDNTASGNGGALNLTNIEIYITNCNFVGNTATTYGGAIYLETSTASVISYTELKDNLAQYGGGAYINGASSTDWTNCLFYENYAITRGATVMIENGTTNIDIINSTMAFNHSSTWSDIWISSSCAPSLDIKNSIINSPIITGGATVAVTYSCLYDDYTSSGVGNINTDPKLTKAGYLTQGSPCLDAGTSTGAPGYDLNFQTRPAGSGIDMGCDEFTDADSDGMPDWFETVYGNGSLSPSGDEDSDNLCNLDEYLCGTFPNNTDTDGDSLNDNYEVSEGYNPLVETVINYVDVDRPDDSGDGLSLSTAKKTINAGLTLAKVNDGKEHVVLVADGTYTGTGNKALDFIGYEIKLRSIDGAETTIIDLENSGRFIWLHYGETSDSWIDGFTFKHGNSSYGGVISLSGSFPAIKNCIFEDNYGSAGGTIYGADSMTTIDNCGFYNNEGSNGGAIYIANSTYKTGFSINNSVFHDNTAINYTCGSAIYLSNVGANISNCDFEGNSAYQNGALYLVTGNCSVNIDRCTFKNNTVDLEGSVICTQSNGTVNITNSLFAGNTTITYWGGVIRCRSGNPTYNITNTTFYGNVGPYPATGISSVSGYNLTLEITNSIIWDTIYVPTGTVTVNYSDTMNDYTSSGVGNLNTDPLLTSDGWLTSASSCIDAGTSTGAPDTDIHNEARPAGSGIDMGCDEYVDSDGDGYSDVEENSAGSDPEDPSSKPFYNVTFIAGANGSINGNTSQVVAHGGSSTEVTAAGDGGYYFVSWSGDYSGSGNPLTLSNVTSDMEVTANFEPNIISIVTDLDTVNVPEGSTELLQVRLSAQPLGDVIVNVAKTSGDSDISVTAGTTLTFTTANWDTYQYSTIGAAEDQFDTDNDSAIISCTSEQADNNKNVTAVESDNDIILMINAGPNGTTTGTGIVDTEDAPYIITATPDQGYHFLNWTGPDAGLIADADSATTTINATSNAEVTANFIKPMILLSESSLTIAEGGTASCTATLSGPPTANEVLTVAYETGDTDISLTSSSTLTFTSANWDQPQTVAFAAATDTDASSDMALFKISGSVYGEAWLTVTEQDSDLSLTVLSDGNGIVDPDGVIAVTMDEEKTVTATPALKYSFDSWTGDVPSGMENTNPLEITVTAPTSLMARFSRKTVTYRAYLETNSIPADWMTFAEDYSGDWKSDVSLYAPADISATYFDNFDLDINGSGAMSDGFESDTAGNPPANWTFEFTDSGDIRVVTSPVSSGANSLKLQGDTIDEQGIYYSGTASSDDSKLAFDAYLPSGLDEGGTASVLWLNGIAVTFVCEDDDEFSVYLGSTETSEDNLYAKNLAPETWHHFILYIDKFVDSDFDNLDDEWEIANFGNLDKDGNSDSDSDGKSDLQEYLDGTDPNAANAKVAFAAESTTASESQGTVNIPVTLTQQAANIVTVLVSIDDASAEQGSDFNMTAPQVVTFSPGETSKNVAVTVINDGITGEPKEHVRLSLTMPNGAGLGTITMHTMYIDEGTGEDTDADGLPDWWEMQFFGNLNQTATGDPDADNADNLTEYLLGRHPNAGVSPDTNNELKFKAFK